MADDMAQLLVHLPDPIARQSWLRDGLVQECVADWYLPAGARLGAAGRAAALQVALPGIDLTGRAVIVAESAAWVYAGCGAAPLPLRISDPRHRYRSEGALIVHHFTAQEAIFRVGGYRISAPSRAARECLLRASGSSQPPSARHRARECARRLFATGFVSPPEAERELRSVYRGRRLARGLELLAELTAGLSQPDVTPPASQMPW
ncbi:hypothetical protein KRX56_05470 [Dermabacteraceae bacterium TAE3-ERU27]|nr:hypothetical protein [Dermabacteraceae bacterium TAE3-ERU27]